MSKFLRFKRANRKRRPASPSLTGFLSLARVTQHKSRSNSLSRLIVAFSIPLIAVVTLSLLTGPMMTPAIAQDAAAQKWTPDTGDTAFMLMSSALVLLMTPGLAFFYGGLVRSRNVLNTMMMSLVAMAVVGVTWVLWGYSLSFAVSSLTDKGFAQGIEQFIGNLNWAFLQNVAFDAPDPLPEGFKYAATIPHQVFMLYQMMFAIITVALVSGSIAERMSFKAFFWFVVLWSTFIYCPLAHMVWGKGLLFKIGALDFAGGTVVHISSGVSALVAAWVLGPRKDWMVRPIVPHNVPFVLLGVGLLWFGWFGFNAGSALGAGALATVAAAATTVATAAGGLAWLVAEWILKGKPTAIGIGSGFVGGLVGITPAAGFVTPVPAIVIGAITSLCCFFAVNLKAKLRFDDSLDTFPVHGTGGTIGALLTGLFATKAVNSLGDDGLLFGNVAQFGENLLGVIIAWVIAGVGTFVILKVLSMFMELRVSPEAEDDGLDIREHGEGAYGEEIIGEVAFIKSVE